MANQKVVWARKELSKQLKGVKAKSQRTQIFKQVWKDAKKKFG